MLDLAVPGVDVAALARAPAGLLTLVPAANVFDRVISLEQGADDSVSKPVAPAGARGAHPGGLALARTARAARAGRPHDALRRLRAEAPVAPTSPAGTRVPLSQAEFALLTAFLDAPREVVSRAQLLARTSDAVPASASRSVDLLVSRLRRKLGAADGASGPIRTVREAGYRLDVESLDS